MVDSLLVFAKGQARCSLFKLFSFSDQSTAEKGPSLNSGVLVDQTATRTALYHMSKRYAKPDYDSKDQQSAFAA